MPPQWVSESRTKIVSGGRRSAVGGRIYKGVRQSDGTTPKNENRGRMW
jgi:hypothetical protein